jgi:hypothetical protein
MDIKLIEDSIVLKMQDALEHMERLDSPPLIMSSGVPRSRGLHLSTILRDLYGYTSNPGDSGLEGNERMALGFAWEHVISWGLGQVFHQADLEDEGIIIHPCEYEKDGITGSPDCLWVYEDLLEEWKATWKSTARHLEEQRLWLWQTMGYCHMIGFDRVRFRVFHVNGSYHKGVGRCAQGPCVKTWLVSFTQDDLLRNWDMILRHRDSKQWPGG